MSNATIAYLDELEERAVEAYRHTYGMPRRGSIETVYAQRGINAMRAIIAEEIEEQKLLKAESYEF